MKPDFVLSRSSAEPRTEPALVAALGGRSVVLVGMMGAGKSSIGRRLAHRLGVSFMDADAEIEAAAGMTIPDIFSIHGEDYFRDGERRVIGRLLQEGPLVLATGGGAEAGEDENNDKEPEQGRHGALLDCSFCYTMQGPRWQAPHAHAPLRCGTTSPTERKRREGDRTANLRSTQTFAHL